MQEVTYEQQRIIANKAAQDDKLAQLRGFYESSGFKALARKDKELLRKQEQFLMKYSGLLGIHISRFESNQDGQ